MVKIRQVTSLDKQVIKLIRELDDYHRSMYPLESNHLDTPDKLWRSGAYMIAAYIENNIVGIGALKLFEDAGYGEIKRMYVSPGVRGQGISKSIMKALEDYAVAQGCNMIRLETGIYQREAIGLYEGFGYKTRGAFGNYPANDPLSIFMEKTFQ